MNNILDAQVFPVAIDLLICRKEELIKHFLGKEGASLAAPVIMMEEDLRFHIFEMLIRNDTFPVCHEVNEVMHCFRLLIEVDHGVFHAHQIMAFLKHTAEDLCGGEILILVHFLKLLDAGFPFLRIQNQVRSLYNFFPLGNIL